MKIRRAFLAFGCIFMLAKEARTQSAQERKIRLAILEIDSSEIEQYKEYLKEEVETSLRVEPGVLTLYPVFEKDNPNQVTIIEIYANEQAYQKHIQTPHFLKYKTGTKDMVLSLELKEVIPLDSGEFKIKP